MDTITAYVLNLKRAFGSFVAGCLIGGAFAGAYGIPDDNIDIVPGLILALVIYIALSVMRYRRDKRLMFAWHAGYGACMGEHDIAAGSAAEEQAEWAAECLPARYVTASA